MLGPVSKKYPAIINLVDHPMLNYTGTQLIAHWTIPQKLVGKSFAVELYKDSQKIADESTTNDQQEFHFTLDSGSIFKSRVRATKGIVQGPWTIFSEGPYAATLIYAYDQLARIESVTWNEKTKLGYTFDNSGNIETIAIAPKTTTTTTKNSI